MFGRSSLRAFFSRFLTESHLLRRYLGKYRRLVVYGLLTLVAVDLLELVPPLLLKSAIDGIVESRPYGALLGFAIAYFVTLFLQGLCRYGWRIFLIRSSILSATDLRSDFGKQLFRLSPSFYDKNRVGDLLSLANSDVDAVRQCVGSGLLVFADAIFYLATVPIAMLWLNPKLALITFLPLPIIPWIVMRNEKKIHERFKAAQSQFSSLSAMAQEGLNGIRVVKSFAREDVQLGRFRDLGEEYIRRNLFLARASSSFGPTMDFFMSLGLVLLLWFGGKLVMADAVTIGTFVAFSRYIQKMVWPMMAIAMGLSHYQRAVASSGRLNEVFRTAPHIVPPAQPRTSRAAGADRIPGRIEFRGLTVGFPGSSEPVLRDISLTIESGQRVAFVGGVGSGKSALLGLIPRLYPAPAGTVFVDGIDVNEWDLRELRHQIGYVSQDVFLFSETVFENLAFGLVTEDVPLKNLRVAEGVRAAAIGEDIDRLPRGYQTLLGERGVNLSGGQKQRMTLARAIAKDPSLLILDDALSAVDVRTEARILRGLRERSRRGTELIAAHRVSTVREADRIYVLDQGRIAEQGTHAELMSIPGGIYARFHEHQRLQEDLEHYLESLERDPA